MKKSNPTVEQSAEVCNTCASYLMERFLGEKGLFRTTVSQTDVRNLQQQLWPGAVSKVKDKPDPHIVAGVLATTLRQMPQSLFYEAYADIVNYDLIDDNTQNNEFVSQCLIKLSSTRFALVKFLFGMLYRMCNVPGTDCNSVQLSFVLSPMMCWPMNSAFMSIRHTADLGRIRLTLSHLIDNFPEIFTKDLRPKPVIVATPPPQQSDTSYNTDSGSQVSSSLPSLRGMNISSGGVGGGDTLLTSKSLDQFSSGDDSQTGSGADNKVGGGLTLLHIPHISSISPPTCDCDVDSAGLTSGMGMDVDNAAAPVVNYNTWEWKVLQSLVMSRVESFMLRQGSFVEPAVDQKVALFKSPVSTVGTKNQLTPSDMPNNASRSYYQQQHGHQQPQQVHQHQSQQSHHQQQQQQQQQTSRQLAAGKSPHTAGQRPGTPSLLAAEPFEGRAVGRRAMIAECKSLRTQIYHFEQEWQRTTNRLPKSSERGPMQAVFVRYRDMKRSIRENSATDIQRWIRGFLVRCKKSRVPTYSTDAWMSSSSSSSSGKSSRVSSDSAQPVLGRHTGSSSAQVDLIHKRKDTQSQSTAASSSPSSSSSPLSSVSTPAAQRNLQQQLLGQGLSTGGGSGGKSNITPVMTSSGSGQWKSNKPAAQSNLLADLTDDELDDTHHSNKSLPPSFNKSTPSIVTLSSAGSAMSMVGDVVEMHAKYRELLSQKRELKRLLKRFDEDFQNQHGRPARRADKEVMRPMYQKYHEVKTTLDAMKAVIETRYGPLPEDLVDDRDRPATAPVPATASASTSGSVVTPAGSGSGAGSLSRRSSSGASSMLSDSEADEREDFARVDSDYEGYDTKGPASNAAAEMSMTWPQQQATASSDQDRRNLDALVEEKRNLHAYLKAYEREFFKKHGRAVMKHEDIQAVAVEYQRYKELKRIIVKDGRSTDDMS